MKTENKMAKTKNWYGLAIWQKRGGFTPEVGASLSLVPKRMRPKTGPKVRI